MQLYDFQHWIFSLIGFLQFAKRTISLQISAVKFYQMMQLLHLIKCKIVHFVKKMSVIHTHNVWLLSYWTIPVNNVITDAYLTTDWSQRDNWWLHVFLYVMSDSGQGNHHQLTDRNPPRHLGKQWIVHRSCTAHVLPRGKPRHLGKQWIVHHSCTAQGQIYTHHWFPIPST